MKRALSVVLALALAVAPVFSRVKDLKGHDKKVYDGALALYASSHKLGIRDRFICSVQVVAKAGNGYLLLGAGHCTPANREELPPDTEFLVADNIGGDLTPVILLQAEMNEPVDYAEYYLRSEKDYPVAELGDENDARIGDETIDVNFTLALGKFVSYGRVSSKVQETGDMKGFFGVDMFDSHGASGSSVVDRRTKKVIGIVIAGVDGATTSSWVEPISAIKKVLSRATLPRSTRPYVPNNVGYNHVREPEGIPAMPEFPQEAPLVGCFPVHTAHVENGQIVLSPAAVACLSQDGQHYFDPRTGKVYPGVIQ